MLNMKLLKEYSRKYGLNNVFNNVGGIRHSTERSIVFPNGWVASIVENTSNPDKKAMYSVAMCDWDGYFDWAILNKYGADSGCFYCNTELEILIACETIRRLENRKPK